MSIGSLSQLIRYGFFVRLNLASFLREIGRIGSSQVCLCQWVNGIMELRSYQQ